MIIERLESRIAPAGLVSLSLKGGALTITGDGADNDIEIFPLGGGDYGFQGNNGTLFDRGLGGGAESFVVLSDIPLAGLKVDLGGGNDVLFCDGMKVAGATSIKGGAGNDTLKFDRLIAFGAVTIDGGDGNDTTSFEGLYSQFRSKFTYIDLLGDNSLRFDSNSLTFSSVQYTTGPGTDSLSFDATAMRIGSLNVDLGEGDGSVSFLGGVFTLKAAVNVKFAQQGSNTSTFVVDADSWHLASGLTVTANSGPATVSFDTNNSRIGGAFKVTTGAGIDAVVVESGEFSVGGATSLSLGAGDNLFSVFAPSFRAGGDVIVNGLGGKDTIDLSAGSLTLAKKSIFNLGGGDNAVKMESASLVLGSVAYTGGSGKDEFLVDAPGRMGAITAALGTGNANVLIGGSRLDIGALTVNSATLAGEELKVSVDAAEARVKATTTITGGAGLSTVTLGYQTGALTLGGDFNFIGGTGEDVVKVIASETVAKKFKVDAGAGNAQFLITADQLLSTGVRFRAQSGVDEVSISAGTGLVGLIDVNGGDGDSSLFVGGADDQLRVAGINFTATGVSVENYLTVARALVTGAVNATTGSSSDGVFLSESIFNGSVLLSTGGGSDNVGIDNDDTYTPSRFRGIFSASLGAGDDFVEVGSDTLAGYARFSKLVLVDGGDGFDVASMLNGFGNTFQIDPVFKNMEDVE